MKTFLVSGAVLLALVAVLLVAASRQPDAFRVARSASIQAAPDKVFTLINDLQRWKGWSPWERIDPALKRSYGGAQAGRGAHYAWEGNKDVGAGRMEITDSVPASHVRIKLDFVRPFEAHNVVDFRLEPRDGATEVTWAMEGQTPLLGKVVHLFVDMDRMVGGQFEAGLANLKALAEK